MPRDSSGNYTLPPGNPVIDGTVIDVNWANPTLSDVAVQMNNLLTRDGLLGATAPIKFNDGTLALPGITWASETTMGIYRPGANTMALAIQGAARQTWTPIGTTLSGNLSVAGTTSFTGGISLVGRLGLADGTVALPSLYFTSDPDTGLYKAGVGELDFGVDGVKKLSMNISSVQVNPSPTASAPSMIAFAGSNVGGPGYAIDILGSGSGTDKAIVRWLNNGYTIERFSITSDNAQILLSVPGALPMVFTTSNTTRLTIAATGEVRVTGAFVAAPNFWVAETGAGAGTVGIASGAGASTVYWGNTSSGLGQMDLFASGQKQVTVNHPGGTVANYWQILGATAGTRVAMEARGSDTNIGIQWVTKGTGDYAFFGNSGVHLQIICTSTGARWLALAGAAAGANPSITASAGLIQFGTSAVNVGSAAPPQSGVATTLTYASSSALGWITPGKTLNNRVTEFYNDSTAFYGRWVDDAYTAGNTWLQVNGGQAAGTTAITFSTIGTFLIFANSPGPSSNGILALTDTGAAGCNIRMTGNGGTTPKKFIRATAGDFQVLNDAYSGVLLGITDAGVLTDIRGLSVARDPGATAGAHAIGSVVIAGTPGGLAIAALSGTVNAATSNLTVFAVGAAANATITAGTWRVCGALSSSSQVALWIRIA